MSGALEFIANRLITGTIAASLHFWWAAKFPHMKDLEADFPKILDVAKVS